VQSLRVSARAAEARVGLSGAQVFTLQKLAEAGRPLSVNELASRTMTHQSSVSVVAALLVEKGLITRARSSADARRLELSLADAGRAVLRRAPRAAQDRLVAALHDTDARDRARLAELLEGLIRSAGLGDETAVMFFDADAKDAQTTPARPARPAQWPHLIARPGRGKRQLQKDKAKDALAAGSGRVSTKANGVDPSRPRR
jgi:DNA-binding MarR family transcriptional regulator